MGLIGVGVGTLLIGAAPSTAIAVALVGALFMGAMISMTNGPIMAVLQSVVAPDMQGRVLSLVGSLATAMTPLSLLVAGPVADALGVRIWYLIGGLVCGVIGAISFFVPSIVRLEDVQAVAKSEAQDDEQLSTADVAAFS